MTKKLPNISPKIILLIIFLIGFFLRFHQLDLIPLGLNRDEAAIAYNALLINQAGQDEWGHQYPLIFDSFGDAKLPVTIYAAVASFRIFGVNNFAVRFASACCGSLLIIATYFLINQFKFKSTSLKKRLALITAFLVAITPWSIFFSRMAFEANLALFLLIIYFIILLKNINQAFSFKTFFCHLFAAIILLISIFTYNTPLILCPFIIILIPFLAGIRNYTKWFTPFILSISILIISIVILLPLSQQKAGITIFTDATIAANYINFRDNTGTGLIQKVFGHKIFYYAQIIFQNTLASFSPNFLVKNINGHPWHTISGEGQLTWSIYLFGLIGIVWLLKNFAENIWSACAHIFRKKNILSCTQIKLLPQDFMLIIFFLALTPAIITVDAPHATRSLLFLYLWLIMAAASIVFSIQKISQLAWQSKKMPALISLLLPLIILIITLNSSLYIYKYFKFFPTQSAIIFNHSFTQIIKSVNTNYPNEPIAIVDPDGYQYVSLAWDLQIPAKEYLSQNTRQLPNAIGLRYGEQVLNYHFIASQADRNPLTEKILLQKNPLSNEWELLLY